MSLELRPVQHNYPTKIVDTVFQMDFAVKAYIKHLYCRKVQNKNLFILKTL